ncbi:MAG: G1 family glutamic endopeptidase [Chloroflexota bacterium]
MQQQDDPYLPAAITDIRRRTHFFRRPDAELDPSRTSEQELWEYGIPPRPDQAQFPVLADLWDKMFPHPLNLTDPYFGDPMARLPVTARAFMTFGGPREASHNWSGAYITPRDGKQFSEVYGHWCMPTVVQPGGVPGPTEYRSSVWIGLDGARQYFDSTLPQIGSAQDLNLATGTSYYLWWQWWMRDNPLTYYFVPIPVPVTAHHEILAQMIVLNATQVLFLIRDMTTNMGFPSFYIDSPSQNGRQARVTGATAEWIVERPADPATGIYTLPNYESVTFTDSYAIQTPAPLATGLSDSRDLSGARLVSMYEIAGTPQRRIPLSKPDNPGRSPLQMLDRDLVTYVGP